MNEFLRIKSFKIDTPLGNIITDYFKEKLKRLFYGVLMQWKFHKFFLKYSCKLSNSKIFKTMFYTFYYGSQIFNPCINLFKKEKENRHYIPMIYP